MNTEWDFFLFLKQSNLRTEIFRTNFFRHVCVTFAAFQLRIQDSRAYTDRSSGSSC